MIEFFREACSQLRCGGEIQAEVLAQVRAQLCQRKRDSLELLQSGLPAVYQPFLGPAEQALQDLIEAIDALELAFLEDSPELASWIALKVQDADEVLRSVQQQLAEHSQMLAEEQ